MANREDRKDKKMWAFLGPYVGVCVVITVTFIVLAALR